MLLDIVELGLAVGARESANSWHCMGPKVRSGLKHDTLR